MVNEWTIKYNWTKINKNYDRTRNYTNAEEYAKKHEKILNYYHDEPETDFKDKKNVYIAGAHSRDEEVNHWKESYEELAEISNELQTEKQALMIENARLSNKWFKCSEQLPKKLMGEFVQM